MPWREMSIMDERREFVMLFEQEGVNRRELCRRFNISPTTGYGLVVRYRQEAEAGLADRSRRPRHSPARTSDAMEALILAVREAHPFWGGRKIGRRLADLGHEGVPSTSTITAVLHRHGRIDEAASEARQRPQRFERAAPNELWQMDFKGHFATGQGRCHPLTVLDDHSRYALCLKACRDESGATVKDALTTVFRRYGLPDRMLMDNGSPWGSSNVEQRYTKFGLWLMALGIEISHGRPYHPQTQGKDERFHRSLNTEAIGRRSFPDLDACQHRFDDWRITYNSERPHEALGLATPISRYRPSWRPFPERLEPFDYGPGAVLRSVSQTARVMFRGRIFKLGRAFAGHKVALEPAIEDGCFNVFFCGHKVATIDLCEPEP